MKKGKPITRLVFWYGTPEYEFHEAFSFVPSSKICSYEDGCEKGYDIIPTRIQKVSAIIVFLMMCRATPTETSNHAPET